MKARLPEYLKNTLAALTKFDSMNVKLKDYARESPECASLLGIIASVSAVVPVLQPRNLQKLDNIREDLQEVYDHLADANAEYESGTPVAG